MIRAAVNWAGLVFFIIAAVILYKQLSKHTAAEIFGAMAAIPATNLLYAILACAVGYFTLALYDGLALKYLNRKLSPKKWLLAGFIGFTVSNNAGTAVVSGGATRYPMYAKWRFKMSEIVKMMVFIGFTYLMGCLSTIILGYFIVPDNVRNVPGIGFITLLCTMAFIGYFAVCAFYKKPVMIRGEEFKIPSVRMGAAQTLLGMADSFFAMLVLYFVATPFIDAPLSVFLGVFVIAQVLGIFSQVPGGLGVFEGLFMLIMPDHADPAQLFGALIAYRIIYFLFPLIIAGLVLSVRIVGSKYRRRIASS